MIDFEVFDKMLENPEDEYIYFVQMLNNEIIGTITGETKGFASIKQIFDILNKNSMKKYKRLVYIKEDSVPIKNDIKEYIEHMFGKCSDETYNFKRLNLETLNKEDIDVFKRKFKMISFYLNLILQNKVANKTNKNKTANEICFTELKKLFDSINQIVKESIFPTETINNFISNFFIYFFNIYCKEYYY